MRCSRNGGVELLDELPHHEVDDGWLWVDACRDTTGSDELGDLAELLSFDPLAVHDAVNDIDLPKVDDFGHHLLIVMHGLCDDHVGTYEIDCVLTRHTLLTIRPRSSPSIEVLWNAMLDRPEISHGTVDEVVARLADVVNRRLLSVIDAVDDQVEQLTLRALAADPDVLGDVVTLRAAVAAVRRAVLPQREVLDLLRHNPSPLISPAGARRFADVFDVASRAASGLDAARSSLSETLEAYRGAEAREATDTTKVLTVYAAVMLPLSLIAGFFGMNHRNLPTVDSDWGWLVVTAAMLVVALLSLGVFVAQNWIRRPSGRKAGEVLGRGLVEAARAPAELAGAVLGISTLPLKGVAKLAKSIDDDPDDPDEPRDPPKR
ncbi:MAG: magnesium transporter CorA family protein [Acidimicrobiales bacterium]